MLPLILAGLAVWWLLRQKSAGTAIMEGLSMEKQAPGDAGGIQLAYLHWVDVRTALGLTTSDKTAIAFSRSFQMSGLASLFKSMGYDWRGVAAISLHETGYGTSHAAMLHDNMFGVSYRGASGIWQPLRYDSLAHCASGFIQTMHNTKNSKGAQRYAGALAVRSTGETFIGALNFAGYNSTESWRRGVLSAYGRLLST